VVSTISARWFLVWIPVVLCGVCKSFPYSGFLPQSKHCDSKLNVGVSIIVYGSLLCLCVGSVLDWCPCRVGLSPSGSWDRLQSPCDPIWIEQVWIKFKRWELQLQLQSQIMFFWHFRRHCLKHPGLSYHSYLHHHVTELLHHHVTELYDTHFVASSMQLKRKMNCCLTLHTISLQTSCF